MPFLSIIVPFVITNAVALKYIGNTQNIIKQSNAEKLKTKTVIRNALNENTIINAEKTAANKTAAVNLQYNNTFLSSKKSIAVTGTIFL